jgi:membrane associated rhomboid family serine protease
MNTRPKKSLLSYIPGFSTNAVLKIIFACAVAYVMLGITWAVIVQVFDNEAIFNRYFLPNIALPHLADLKSHWWTVFTYGWFHFSGGFFELLSNMLWFYCFGNVVQMLVGHRQILPLFVYSVVAGGVVYLLAQLLPGELGRCPQVLLGPRAALAAMAAAAVTLTPNYRFYLTDRIHIHILVIAAVFFGLMVLGSGLYVPVILQLLAGAATGYIYVVTLRNGYRPGDWMYNVGGKIEGIVTPDEEAIRKKKAMKRQQVLSSAYEAKTGVSQKRIDDILDKINQKGYNALSAEEKDILMRAAKDQ